MDFDLDSAMNEEARRDVEATWVYAAAHLKRVVIALRALHQNAEAKESAANILGTEDDDFEGMLTRTFQRYRNARRVLERFGIEVEYDGLAESTRFICRYADAVVDATPGSQEHAEALSDFREFVIEGIPPELERMDAMLAGE